MPSQGKISDMVPTKILIIEDEQTIADLIEMSLKNLDAETDKVTSAEQAQFLIQNKKYDLAIVDWMLPQEQGPDLIQRLKKDHPNLLFLMVTAKADTESIVEGLSRGADDYLTKPFDNRILLARVKNLLRRVQYNQHVSTQKSEDVIEFNGLKIDFLRVQVAVRGESIHLTPSEFKLLGHLLKSQGRVLSRDQLVNLIQGEDVTVTGRTIDTHVFALRKKMGDWADTIETIRGVGYRVNYTL